MAASPCLMQLQLGYAMLANSVALRTLGLDHVMYLREEEAGMWILPYYLAKLLSTLPMLLLQPVAFSMSYVPIATPAQVGRRKSPPCCSTHMR